jgi:type III secretion system needle length determinant
MSTFDPIKEPTRPAPRSASRNESSPWRAQDAGVQSAAMRFAAILDDSSDSDNARPSDDSNENEPDEEERGTSSDNASPHEAASKPKSERRQSSGDERGRQGDSHKKPHDASTDRSDAAYQPPLPFGNSPAAESSGNVAAAPNVDQAMWQMCNAIADRVLISDMERSGGIAEVRITIKNAVLSDTEVRISVNGGVTSVAIVTGDIESYDLLAANSQALQNRLSDRLGDAHVDVELDAARQKSDNSDAGQDGRSRQRRSVFDEQEENKKR